MNRWVGDGGIRVNIGISLVGRIEMFILTGGGPKRHGGTGGVMSGAPGMTGDGQSTDIAVWKKKIKTNIQ